MKQLIVLFFFGFHLVGCQSTETVNQQVFYKSYLLQANQDLPRYSVPYFVTEVIREEMQLVTILNFAVPGTPTSDLLDFENVRESLKTEFNSICRNVFFNSLVEQGFEFKLRLVNNKGSYKVEKHDILPEVTVRASDCSPQKPL